LSYSNIKLRLLLPSGTLGARLRRIGPGAARDAGFPVCSKSFNDWPRGRRGGGTGGNVARDVGGTAAVFPKGAFNVLEDQK